MFNFYRVVAMPREPYPSSDSIFNFRKKKLFRAIESGDIGAVERCFSGCRPTRPTTVYRGKTIAEKAMAVYLECANPDPASAEAIRAKKMLMHITEQYPESSPDQKHFVKLSFGSSQSIAEQDALAYLYQDFPLSKMKHVVDFEQAPSNDSEALAGFFSRLISRLTLKGSVSENLKKGVLMYLQTYPKRITDECADQLLELSIQRCFSSSRVQTRALELVCKYAKDKIMQLSVDKFVQIQRCFSHEEYCSGKVFKQALQLRVLDMLKRQHYDELVFIFGQANSMEWAYRDVARRILPKGLAEMTSYFRGQKSNAEAMKMLSFLVKCQWGNVKGSGDSVGRAVCTGIACEFAEQLDMSVLLKLLEADPKPGLDMFEVACSRVTDMGQLHVLIHKLKCTDLMDFKDVVLGFQKRLLTFLCNPKHLESLLCETKLQKETLSFLYTALLSKEPSVQVDVDRFFQVLQASNRPGIGARPYYEGLLLIQALRFASTDTFRRLESGLCDPIGRDVLAVVSVCISQSPCCTIPEKIVDGAWGDPYEAYYLPLSRIFCGLVRKELFERDRDLARIKFGSIKRQLKKAEEDRALQKQYDTMMAQEFTQRVIRILKDNSDQLYELPHKKVLSCLSTMRSNSRFEQAMPSDVYKKLYKIEKEMEDLPAYSKIISQEPIRKLLFECEETESLKYSSLLYYECNVDDLGRLRDNYYAMKVLTYTQSERLEGAFRKKKEFVYQEEKRRKEYEQRAREREEGRIAEERVKQAYQARRLEEMSKPREVPATSSKPVWGSRAVYKEGSFTLEACITGFK